MARNQADFVYGDFIVSCDQHHYAAVGQVLLGGLFDGNLQAVF